MIKYYKLLDVLNRREMTKEELRIKLNLSSATIAKISKNEFISLRVINDICSLLNRQPGELLEYIPDEK